jgi:hypothetical protein
VCVIDACRVMPVKPASTICWVKNNTSNHTFNTQKKSCPSGAALACKITTTLTHRNLPGVNAGSNRFAIGRNKTNIGFNQLTCKSAQVNTVGKGAAVGAACCVNTLVKGGAVRSQHSLVGRFSTTNAASVCPAKSYHAACARHYRWTQYVRQVTTANQYIAVHNGKGGVGTRYGILQQVTQGTVHACFFYRKSFKANANKAAHGLQKLGAQFKLKLLRQLRHGGVFVFVAALAAHVINAFPVATYHGANFSGESAKDSFLK